MNEILKHIGQPRYAIIDAGLFGVRIVSGIVVGFRFTEEEPIYEIAFGRDKWWSSIITDNTDDIISHLKLGSLERIRESHKLSIKYETNEDYMNYLAGNKK
ncbi:MAG TPA: hypothetical protein VLA48_02730 [Nitrososphaeraceae archaeon]|nr:hypothetical protein [Nitrososphaeraceae archaeon]